MRGSVVAWLRGRLAFACFSLFGHGAPDGSRLKGFKSCYLPTPCNREMWNIIANYTLHILGVVFFLFLVAYHYY
ncbi:hypothetical protein GGS26DRAFT_544451 [Hypomontagnella submonticulosa]|nr:hypothetical protein GGS26DRAFT_544451 [Hypomontagnella submonticulosa]